MKVSCPFSCSLPAFHGARAGRCLRRPRGRRRAQELSEAFEVLSIYDQGADLGLYYKHLMVLEGNPEYARHFDASDELAPSQRAHAEAQLRQFKSWYASWSQEDAGPAVG